MSAGKEAARDTVYGRRGGGWVPPNTTETSFSRLCESCGLPMVGGQKRVHFACCPGLQSGKTACNPQAFAADGLKFDGCAYCYDGTRKP